jgi:hypothetical protein
MLPLIVEAFHDRPDVLLEDATDYFRFGRIDLENASRIGRLISVRLATSVPAVSHDAGHAAVNHDFQILKILAVDNSFDPVGEPGDDPIDGGHHADADERQSFTDGRAVFFVASNAAHRFSDDDVETAFARSNEQLLNASALMDGSARYRSVIKNRDDLKIVALRKRSAKRDLIVDRAFILQVGREPSIDCGPIWRRFGGLDPAHGLPLRLGAREPAQGVESPRPASPARIFWRPRAA